MTKEEKKVLREKILLTISKIEKDVTDLRELTKPIPPENAIGRVSRMDAINNKSVNEAALRRANTKLGRLQKALFKVDTDDSFGTCMACKKGIQTARLMFLPESTHCIRCAH